MIGTFTHVMAMCDGHMCDLYVCVCGYIWFGPVRCVCVDVVNTFTHV